MANQLDKLKEHFDKVISDNKAEMLADNAEIKLEIKQTNDKIEELKDKVDKRVKPIELAEARRQGLESAKGGDGSDWKKLTFMIVGIIATAVSLALLIAQAYIK